MDIRKGNDDEGLKYVKRVLENNTYDGGANYMFGVLEQSLGNFEKALEAFSVSARTMEYRSGSYVRMAGIKMLYQDFQGAANYARKSLDYNSNNLMAYEFLASCYRKINNPEAAKKILDQLVEIDPLNHFANFETYLWNPTADNLQIFKSAIRNELPQESYLELALQYVKVGLQDEAIKVLEQAPEYPTVYYWLAYLTKDNSKSKSREYLNKAVTHSPFLVFPFRLESIPVLQWAQSQHASWKNHYYLGLLYWSILEVEKAREQFNICEEEPDYAPFYISRSILLQKNGSSGNPLGDLKKANQISPVEWRTWHALNDYYMTNGFIELGVRNAKKAYRAFPKNPIIGMDYAKLLMLANSYDQSIEVLDKIHFLPQEGARAGHDIFVLAHLSNAVKKIKNSKYIDAIQNLGSAKLWPENLGTGEPYDPDYRLHDYIAAYAEAKLGNRDRVNQLESSITQYSVIADNWNNGKPLNNYISALLLKKCGQKPYADALMDVWKVKQDSIQKWSLGAGFSSSEVKWVLAKYAGQEKKADDLKNIILANDKSGFSKLFFEAIKLSDSP